MGGKRHRIGGAEREGQAAGHLHRIQMQQSAMRPAEFRNGFNGMQHAGFIIGGHDRNQSRPTRAQRRFQRCQIQGAIGKHRDHPSI